MDTGGYTALDFALHDSHVLNANVFMRPLGRVDVRTIIIIIIIIIMIYRLQTFNSSMWSSLRLAPIIIANYNSSTVKNCS